LARFVKGEPLDVGNDVSLTKDMSYDWANRITKVVNPATGETMGRYEYDDQGFRVRRVASKVIDGTPEEIVLTTANKYFVMERRRNAAGQDIPGTDVAINNVYLNGKRIASMDASAKTYFYLADNVDSVKVVTNDIGEAVSRMEYLPYGETFATESQTQPPICATDPTDPSCKVFAMVPKYNGQSLDPETMLYFYNARHYDPEIARFVTADTVVDGRTTIKGWNRYMYVGGNPIMYKDPTGHAAWDWAKQGYKVMGAKKTTDEENRRQENYNAKNIHNVLKSELSKRISTRWKDKNRSKIIHEIFNTKDRIVQAEKLKSNPSTLAWGMGMENNAKKELKTKEQFLNVYDHSTAERGMASDFIDKYKPMVEKLDELKKGKDKNRYVEYSKKVMDKINNGDIRITIGEREQEIDKVFKARKKQSFMMEMSPIPGTSFLLKDTKTGSNGSTMFSKYKKGIKIMKKLDRF